MAEGGRVRVANTLPDVNADEVLARSTGTPAPTCASCSTPAARRSRRRRDGGQQPRRRISARRSSASSPPRATARSFTGLLVKRRAQHQPRRSTTSRSSSTALGAKDEQLAALVDSANANFEAFASEEGNLREALHAVPGRARADATTLRDGGRAGRRARPDARGPAAVRARAGARPCAASARSSARPRRSSATRSALRPRRRSRRCATCAPPPRSWPRSRRGSPQLQGPEQLLQHAGLQPARAARSPTCSGAAGRRTPAPPHDHPGRPRRRCSAAWCCCPAATTRRSSRSSWPTPSSACSPGWPTSPTRAGVCPEHPPPLPTSSRSASPASRPRSGRTP